MPAGTYDLTLEQGADLDETFTWAAEDGSRRPFTGWEFHSQIRARPGGRVLLELDDFFTVVPDVDVDGVTGEGLRLHIPGADTAALSVQSAVWDLLLIQPGPPAVREFLLAGSVAVRQAVTVYA